VFVLYAWLIMDLFACVMRGCIGCTSTQVGTLPQNAKFKDFKPNYNNFYAYQVRMLMHAVMF
jgi:hypothetical protein